MRGISSIPLVGCWKWSFPQSCDCHDNDSSDDLNDVSNNAGDDNDGDALEPAEQNILITKGSTILEFFLAMIRLHSQNAVGWWSIVAPLAHYLKGHSMNLPKHPLHGSGANIKTALTLLDKLSTELSPAITNMIANQKSASLVLNNFQQLSSKKVQSGGSLPTYSRAVTYFVK